MKKSIEQVCSHFPAQKWCVCSVSNKRNNKSYSEKYNVIKTKGSLYIKWDEYILESKVGKVPTSSFNIKQKVEYEDDKIFIEDDNFKIIIDIQ